MILTKPIQEQPTHVSGGRICSSIHGGKYSRCDSTHDVQWERGTGVTTPRLQRGNCRALLFARLRRVALGRGDARLGPVSGARNVEKDDHVIFLWTSAQGRARDAASGMRPKIVPVVNTSANGRLQIVSTGTHAGGLGSGGVKVWRREGEVMERRGGCWRC